MKQFKSLLMAILYVAIALLVELGIAALVGTFMSAWYFTKGYTYTQVEDMVVTFGNSSTCFMIVGFSFYILCFFAFYFWFLYARKRDAHFAVKASFSYKNVALVFVIAICLQLAAQVILQYCGVLLPKQFEDFAKLTNSMNLDDANPILMLVLVGVLGPFVEELLFRGMIYRRLRQAFDVLPAAVISGLMFGIFHMNLLQFIYTSLFGIVLAYTYEKTKRLSMAVWMHILFNLSSYLVDYLFQRFFGDVTIPHIFMVLILVVATAASVLLVRKLAYKEKRCQDDL